MVVARDERVERAARVLYVKGAVGPYGGREEAGGARDRRLARMPIFEPMSNGTEKATVQASSKCSFECVSAKLLARISRVPLPKMACSKNNGKTARVTQSGNAANFLLNHLQRLARAKTPSSEEMKLSGE